VTEPSIARLDYEEHGKGQPVVLIHGLGLSRHSWRHVAPVLAREFRVITADNRGHGKSEAPPPPWTTDLFAADIAALLDRLEIERAVFVGHSMGGGIAQTMALEHPARTVGVALVASGPALPEPNRASLRNLADQLESSGQMIDVRVGLRRLVTPEFAGSHPEEMEAEASRMIADARSYAYSCRANAGRDLSGRLGDLHCPLLYVGGEQDGGNPAAVHAVADLYREQVPGARVHVIPGAAHMIGMEAPEKLNRLLLEFLRDVTS